VRGDVYLWGVASCSKRRAKALVDSWVSLLPCMVLSFAGACGGSEANAGTAAKSAHEASSADRDETASESDAPDAPTEEEAPKARPCDDGTCSACGSGVCPTGWYCDESATGGPACGWLPQCAQKNSCGCLTGKLGPSCKCSEQAGGLHVTCK
jgi:hypothetical protein